MKQLEIRNLHVAVEGKEILKGLDLAVPVGEIHAIMGPNGSGKSTLASAVMGHPKYEVTAGEILWNGEELQDLEPDERAKRGLFLAFQYPQEIYGVSVMNFLRLALTERFGKTPSLKEFNAELEKWIKLLDIKPEFTKRFLNEGFSGGEKKRNEVLQMGMLKPEMAIMDETDSGLDIDALKIVSRGVNELRGEGFGALVITHYQRLLNYIVPDVVHILVDGKIVKSGDKDLALELERAGYDWVKEEAVV
ncbi:Fe-S cluster assembly ATPase SufC [bacterium]|nr:Fe-S cluster assembly ATPase SufC [bacterium]MBU1638172.1 Fe-S cluster assembly ATPase SufC [bacterium]RQV98939.1 MAG: Fe-S cluster assembly ATPase SufC [bacterium]